MGKRQTTSQNRARAAQQLFFSVVAHDGALLCYLARDDASEFRIRLEEQICADPVKLASAPLGVPSMRTFLQWCSSAHGVPELVTLAVMERATFLSENRFAKREFLAASTLNWSALHRDAYVHSIPVITARPMNEAYPPLGMAIAQTLDIHAKCNVGEK
ncbi:hypothetical protein DXG01_009397, partial [Tephrocybe rancida]